MQAPFDNIVQHLFHQPSLLSVTVDELERMAAQHPYFAAAHFLLLKKMQDTDHPQFNTQLHKTTLYFNNPLWLQFLLKPETVSNFKVSDRAPFIGNEPGVDTTVPDETIVTAVVNDFNENSEQENNNAVPALIEDHIAEPSNGHAAHTGTPETNASIMEVITEVFHEIPDDSGNDASETELITEPPRENLYAGQTTVEESAATPLPDETPAEIPAPVTAEEYHIDEPEAAGAVYENLTETSPEQYTEQPAETIEPAAEEDNITANAANELYAEPAEAEHLDQPAAEPAGTFTETTTENNTIEMPPDDVQVTAQPEAETIEAAEETNQHAEETGSGPEAATNEPREYQPLKPMLKIIETTAASGDMLFEPYHTVDYFASQGIQLSKMEAEGKDKLGKKLRSFTDWLKTMKKLPQASIENILSKNEESKVVEDAIHSIENKEVITEAMAEVFEKQGMNDKAAEVYRKLSLLNPAKSAYFAARIDDLKH